ncbi:hypothetical protein [Halobellus rarus]|uniref:Uncharacterized protein n=1 Tax=Halobellus rarus TaxID=1126237 RepID=A0ABD6CSN1_9EURY|nr:hypothetical protein [Halobellus rarus]
MCEEDIRESLDEAKRVFGLSDGDPDHVEECPGCGGEVPVWDLDNLPMGYECYQCGANYTIKERGVVELIREW